MVPAGYNMVYAGEFYKSFTDTTHPQLIMGLQTKLAVVFILKGSLIFGAW